VRLVRFRLRSDSQAPSNGALSWRVPGVLVQRKWFRGVGNCFTSTPAASIDARSEGRFSGLIFLVELRTDADFYVVAAPEECHRRPSFAELNAGNSAVSCRQAWDSAHMSSRTRQKGTSAAHRPYGPAAHRLSGLMCRLHHQTDHLADMDRRLVELRAFDGDAVIGLASDLQRSDQAWVRSITLTVAIDQDHPAASVSAVPPCSEVAGWPVDDDRLGGRWRGRLRRGGPRCRNSATLSSVWKNQMLPRRLTQDEQTKDRSRLSAAMRIARRVEVGTRPQPPGATTTRDFPN
jgi:hypothetical protein